MMGPFFSLSKVAKSHFNSVNNAKFGPQGNKLYNNGRSSLLRSHFGNFVPSVSLPLVGALKRESGDKVVILVFQGGALCDDTNNGSVLGQKKSQFK